MYMLLANIINNQPIEGFVDKLEFGGMMIALGMGTVFSVLIILWFALVIFKFAFHDLPSKRKAKSVAPAVAPEPVIPVTNNTNDEIVAAIAAAIAMAESESDGVKFRVVSFRRR